MGVRTDTADALRGVGSVLVVDDDEIVATSIARSLASRDVAVTTAGSEADALAQLDRRRFDLVLLDLQFPGDWRRVLLTARATTPPSLVVMVSGRGSIESAVESIRLGASDFVEKPFAYDELRQRIRRAVTAYENGLRPSPPPSSASPSARARRHVVPSTPSYDAWSLADRVASTPACPALLVGESGVGKEILAERIHERSARGSGPFVRVSLAAIAEAIVESELFGSVAGALTDSHGEHAGFFGAAHGGTILLDELTEFNCGHQAKLLRILERRSLYAVGSTEERHVDVRVLASTNKTAEQLLDENLIRRDLFYRLGTVIHIPPLRDRRDEILPLAEHLVTHEAGELGRAPLSLSPATSQALLDYHWPGNIRELRNVLQRAVMLCDGAQVEREHVMLGAFAPERPPSYPGIASPASSGAPSSGDPASLRLEDARQKACDQVEREHIARVLRLAEGSRSRAATMLGISRSTLYQKLSRYGLD